MGEEVHFEEADELRVVLAEGVSVIEVGAQFYQFGHLAHRVDRTQFHQSALGDIALDEFDQSFKLKFLFVVVADEVVLAEQFAVEPLLEPACLFLVLTVGEQAEY